jgi:hypothetical protein
MNKMLLNHKLWVIITLILCHVQWMYSQCNLSTPFIFQSYLNKSANDLIFQSVISSESIYGKACNGILHSPLTYNEIISTALNPAGPLIEISVSPNPFTQNINVDWRRVDLSCTIEIFNSLGVKIRSLIRTHYSNSTQIDTGDLIPGFYVICISNLKYHYSIKLLKL